MNSWTNFHIFIPLSLQFLQLAANAQSTHRTISLGSSLSPGSKNSSWPSPSGEFAFGFYPLPQKDFFVLAIWFDKIPARTVIWSANGGDPVSRGSKLALTTTGQLLLTDDQGKEVWQRNRGSVAYASMLDTGNFVLVINNTNSNYTWQSFDEPTDTILPTQVIEMGTYMYSSQTATNFSRGRFRLDFQNDRNLVLYRVSIGNQVYDAYWDSKTVDLGSQLIFNLSGSISLVLTNGTRLNLTSGSSVLNLTSGSSVSPGDLYQRATLDFDGVFRQYGYPKTPNNLGQWPQSWSLLFSIPSDICWSEFKIGSGICGFNSYCKADENTRVICLCPNGFTYLDPSDQSKGCKPDNLGESCQTHGLGKGPQPEFEMVDMVNVDWPDSDFELFNSFTEDDCRETCSNDCLCRVAFFRGNSCWKKKFPLTNGRIDPRVKGKSLIKVYKNTNSYASHPDPGQMGKKNKKGSLVVLLSVLLGSSLFFLLLAAIFVGGFMVQHKRRLPRFERKSDLFDASLRSFTYKELEKTTDGFKEELGNGASGTVYKGVLPSSHSTDLVAVKKLEKLPKEKHDEFKNEVRAIGRVHHKNLVPLLGFCEEGPNRLLVYEFMANGSLASFLFRDPKPNWNQRMELAAEIARGLVYLHEDCSNRIIHCDIKPQNILLDESFTARISDFGLAKLLKANQTRTMTDIRGTKGYVAPEWFKSMPITAKVDVFSYGVVLMEIICCRKSVEVEMEDEEKVILTDWFCDCYTAGKMDLLVEKDHLALNDSRRLERSAKVAIWCIQADPSIRPSMKRVTQMLEGTVEIPIPPDSSSVISVL